MGTPRSLVLPALFVWFSGLAASVSSAQPSDLTADPQGSTRITQIATLATGTITGQVLDDTGQPLPDVVVSAVGGTTSFALSDRTGQFTLRSLTPGPYLIRAHLDGYVSARQSIVTVRPSARTVSTFTLRRMASPGQPGLLAAGASEVAAPEAERGRDEGETAWRLRRLKRSILKSETGLEGLSARDDWFVTESLQFLGRAFESSARMAGSLFTHSPFVGEVNLLTTGAFDAPGELLQLERTRGVAFFSVGAPVGGHGDWNVKAALNHGDLSSWIVAGNYVTRAPARHRYQLGMSYGLHRYEGGNIAALAAITETARNVGAVYAYDDWKLSDRLSIGYGGHYAHYDYLQDPAHLSPRLSATFNITERVHLRAVAARRVTAPGAEEFLPPARAQVLPPQRTFAPVTADGVLLPEDMQHYEVGVERTLEGVTIGVRAFQQTIDDQLVTVFGLRGEGSVAAEIGHYFVGSAGNVDVQGWGVTVAHALTPHLRGSFDYSLSTADWGAARTGDSARLARRVPSAVRDDERVHDFTTALETDVPVSATRVFVLYKMNSAYTRADDAAATPGLDGRWDVQVIQGLPFLNFTSAQWEMLVGIRNLFRESFSETSVYDELLVARPPKRLVGGITVKF